MDEVPKKVIVIDSECNIPIGSVCLVNEYLPLTESYLVTHCSMEGTYDYEIYKSHVKKYTEDNELESKFKIMKLESEFFVRALEEFHGSNSKYLVPLPHSFWNKFCKIRKDYLDKLEEC